MSHRLFVVVAMFLSIPEGRAAQAGRGFGFWEGLHGEFVSIMPGAAPGTIAFAYHNRRPAKPTERPNCLTYQAAAGPSLTCWVPLQQCRRRVEVTGRDTLQIRFLESTGADCDPQKETAAVVLQPLDPVAVYSELYLPQARAYSWDVRGRKLEGLATLADQPTTGAARLARLLLERWRRDAGPRWLPDLRLMMDYMRVLHYRLVHECGEAATVVACPSGETKRITAEVFRPAREVSERINTGRALLWPVVPTPIAGHHWQKARLWLGVGAEYGANSGALAIGPGQQGSVEVTLSEGIQSSSYLCRGRMSLSSDQAEIDCERCGRKLVLEQKGGEIVAQSIGDGWREGCSCDEDSSCDSQFVFVMRPADPFLAVVDKYVSEASKSDFGSAGGRIFYVTLGKHPQRTVRTLATRLRAIVASGGADPRTFSLEQTEAMVTMAQVALLQECKGLPHGDPASRCSSSRMEAVLVNVVRQSARDKSDSDAPP